MRLYLQNTYLLNHNAKVTKVDKDAQGDFVLLDETIFHPQGGGQPSDQGTIGGVKIKKVVSDQENVKHYLETAPTFKENDSVDLVVDKEKRLTHAVLHSTGHLLASVVREQFGFKNQKSGHHFPGECRVVFVSDAKVPTKEEVEKAIHESVAKKIPITVKSIDGQRHIDIAGFEPGRCAGTHLSSTEEISGFVIRKLENKKGEVSFGYTCSYNFDYKPAEQKEKGSPKTDLFRVKGDVNNDNNATQPGLDQSAVGLGQ